MTSPSILPCPQLHLATSCPAPAPIHHIPNIQICSISEPKKHGWGKCHACLFSLSAITVTALPYKVMPSTLLELTPAVQCPPLLRHPKSTFVNVSFSLLPLFLLLLLCGFITGMLTGSSTDTGTSQSTLLPGVLCIQSVPEGSLKIRNAL